ncbi:guanylate-binding protein 1-like [Orbicella faveolata]|uniref:guanylate-binding protein 1-like n=1 Tax=Orbicella faveolata TaxID=48498 RepID=UPI0009E556CF|nr:guanylate-binding protein 1-like [Orbicella faveolata]
MAAIPLCIPDNCDWNETSGNFQRDQSQPRTGLQLVNAALRKLKAIQGPVCVVSIAGPCRRGKSYILSRAFDQGDVFPLGHSFDPETMGIWMWVVPEKYVDERGREFTVVLLDSEGTDAVGAEGRNDDTIFTLSVLLSSVLIYNSVGVPTRTDLEGLDHIINISQRIQVIAGQPLADEDSRKVFPSFVWLLRDVLLSLPKGVENLRTYFLEKVFNAHGRPSEKSQKVVDNILKFFPDFDAFPLCPPSSKAEVIQNLTEEGRQGEINVSFKKGVEDFKQMLRTKLSPKRSVSGQGVVTGEALATLVEEYVRAANSPGAVPVIQSAWDVFTTTKCTQTLNDAKAVYEGGMKEFRERVRLPCDDKKIRSSHEDHLLEALTFFESETEDTTVTARWLYMEELANFADESESALLRENNKLTEEQCSNLMKTLRMVWLDPVIKDLHDADNTEFLVLEERLRSVYHKLDCDFRQQAAGSKNLCFNLAYIYELQHSEEMKKHLAQLKTRRLYFEQIASERAAKEAEAEETEKIRRENLHLAENRKDIEDRIARLEQEHIEEERKVKRMKDKQMRAQREQTEAAVCAARERSAAEKEKYSRQQRELQAQIEAARRKQQELEATINTLREKLRRM